MLLKALLCGYFAKPLAWVFHNAPRASQSLLCIWALLGCFAIPYLCRGFAWVLHEAPRSFVKPLILRLHEVSYIVPL